MTEPVTLTTDLTALMEQVQSVTGLGTNEAKTLVYWALGTHSLPKLNIFPILSIKGEYGTGKTTLLAVLQQLVHLPEWIGGDASRAVLRDSLRHESTALIDEGDIIKEALIRDRYSRRSAQKGVNREVTHGWKMDNLKTFGATAVHRRNAFKDPAVDSRTVVVLTRRVAGGVKPFRDEDFAPWHKVLKALAAEIPWEKLAQDSSSREVDTWGPLLVVAQYLEDTTWLAYANERVEAAQASIARGGEQEPTKMVFRAIVASVVEELDGNSARSRNRVSLAQVKEFLDHEGLTLNSWQIGEAAPELGFEVKNVGGVMYVYVTGLPQLRAVGKELGVSDEVLDDAA